MQYHIESNTRHEENGYSFQYDVNVFSILGFVMAFCSWGAAADTLICSMLAIIFSGIAKCGLKEQDKLGKHLSTAGLVIGIIITAGVICNYYY